MDLSEIAIGAAIVRVRGQIERDRDRALIAVLRAVWRAL
jgi:hypothetical protein